MHTKHTIKISLTTQSTKENFHHIRIRVSCKNKRIDLYPNMAVKENQWNKDKQRIKQGCNVNGIQYNILNNDLVEYETFIHEYFNSCDLRGVEPLLKELQDKFHKKYKTSSKEDSEEFYYQFNCFINEKDMTRNWSKSMKETFTRLKNILYNFNPHLSFNELSTSF